MNTSNTPNLKTILKNSIKKSTSYQEYRDLVSQLTEKKASTGDTQNELMSNYTMLNDRRMKRWDKTIKINPDTAKKISDLNKKVTWLVLTESWCGDAAHLMPVMNKIANLNDNIEFRVVLRDENDALMNAFLTNGGKSIPMLIMIDEDTESVINTFGPRPSEATKIVNDYKVKHGKLTPEFKEDLQKWYNKDKGQTAINDLIDLSFKK